MSARNMQISTNIVNQAMHHESAIDLKISPITLMAGIEIELETLTQALLQYGTHLPMCEITDFRDETDCTCGWTKLEAQLQQPLTPAKAEAA